MLQRKADPALLECFSDIAQTFEHKGVMPQVCFRVIIREAEADKQRLLRLIRTRNGVLERIIASGALRLLHPVEHVIASGGRQIIQLRNP